MMVMITQLGKCTKIIEFYIWNGWILWYINYTSIKLFFKWINDLVEATTNLILYKILKKVDLKK